MKNVQKGYMKLTPHGWTVSYGRGNFHNTLKVAPDDCKDFEFTDRGWIFFKIVTIDGKERAKIEKRHGNL